HFVVMVRLRLGLDVVHPPYYVSRYVGLARLDLSPVQFLDEAHVSALVAPRLGRGRRIEGHSREPRPRLAIDLHLVGPDHPLRRFRVVALVEEPGVRTEIVLELGRRDRLVAIAEVDGLKLITAF